MTVKQIAKELLRLDARSRAKLAERLLHSLDELSEVENERFWAQEALRRHQALIRGREKGRSADEVLREARARLKSLHRTGCAAGELSRWLYAACEIKYLH